MRTLIWPTTELCEIVLYFFHWKLTNIAQQLSATLESEAVMTSLRTTLHQQNRVFSVAHSSLIKSSGVVQCRVCFYIPSKSNSCGQTRVSSVSTVVRGSYLNQYEISRCTIWHNTNPSTPCRPLEAQSTAGMAADPFEPRAFLFAEVGMSWDHLKL